MTPPPGFVPAGDGTDRIALDRLALIGRWSETFGLNLDSEVEAALATQEAAHVAHLTAVAAHDALCWVQPDDGRLVGCDRARGHKGDHSWELVPAAEVRRRLHERAIQTRVDVAEEIAAAIAAVRETAERPNYIAALTRAEKIALAHRLAGGGLAEEDPVAVEPKTMGTVLTFRIDSDLAARLREEANRRGCVVSDLLREGAEMVIRAADPESTMSDQITIFIAMVNDRHVEPQAHPFSTAEAAIDYARRTAQEYAHSPEDFREEPVDGWLYHATYSVEGDGVWVVEKTLDEAD